MLFSGAVAMTVAFLYMLLWMLSHYTSHDELFSPVKKLSSGGFALLVNFRAGFGAQN